MTARKQDLCTSHRIALGGHRAGIAQCHGGRQVAEKLDADLAALAVVLIDEGGIAEGMREGRHKRRLGGGAGGYIAREKWVVGEEASAGEDGASREKPPG